MPSAIYPHATQYHTTTPTASYGSERDRNNINQILRGSDWWQRHCFINQLQAR